MLLTGELLSAEEVLSYSLINKIVVRDLVLTPRKVPGSL